MEAKGNQIENAFVRVTDKQQAEELQELAGEIEESNIRALLQRVAEVYVNRFDHAEKERGNFEFLQTVRADYLPEVEKMARKYIQMEKLDETAKDTFAAENFWRISREWMAFESSLAKSLQWCYNGCRL